MKHHTDECIVHEQTFEIMKDVKLAVIVFILTAAFNLSSWCETFTYHWEISEMPSGVETVSVVQPIQVDILGNLIQASSDSAALKLANYYSVYLSQQWEPNQAYLLLQMLEAIPQHRNYLGNPERQKDLSFWFIIDGYVENDIRFSEIGGTRFVTISSEVFNYADQKLARIEGVRGRFFSKRLHHAVVRYVTDNGADRYAIERILRDRYDVRVSVPDYQELTRNTTGEHAGRFSEFKNEELIDIVSMLEEFPSGMLKTPGLQYLVRRLDGTPHPLHPEAGAVAWPSAGYIEFMEGAFKGGSPDSIHRLILHEKAHFLWAHLFDDQLKQDWIELGGWFETPDDGDGWATTKQIEFVSAYAHGKNPNEDMAESISFYIVNPDKLRSRSPAKYEFIQNRVMHGTRYISRIREDLTFHVYNLYPDYVYPGKIIRVDITADGGPEEDKLVTVEIEIHGESDLDAARSLYVRIFSEAGTFNDIRLYAIDENGRNVPEGHVFRGQEVFSRYAKSGYWAPDQISFEDAHGHERHQSERDFGWKLYIDNPLEDLAPPEYVKDSMGLALSQAVTSDGRPYQIVTASWEVIEASGIARVNAALNDNFQETYSTLNEFEYGGYVPELGKVVVKFNLPDYMPSGMYALNKIGMLDVARNSSKVYFTAGGKDEAPKTIRVETSRPDLSPPVLDINRITVRAEPTIPEAPNGETIVDISFWIKDNISGYAKSGMYLRDPHGVMHHFWHLPPGRGSLYFNGDPTVFKEYHQRIVLPVGSTPGTWGLAEMTLFDKASNILKLDFTEIVRFEVGDNPAAPTLLLTSIPERTQLLTNYPNPFNPETWIPYHLSEGTDVKIRICDITGSLVRLIDVGFQPAGFYESSSRAARWDGRNGFGEQAANGIYFYQLDAGSLSDLRKMVILK